MSEATDRRVERIGPRRPVKLNVCVSEQERAELRRHAQQAGFENVSAYVRFCTLGGAARDRH